MTRPDQTTNDERRSAPVLIVAALALALSLVLSACSGAADDAQGSGAPSASSSGSEATAPTEGDAEFNDTDVRFTQNMLPHHMQALRVAQVEVEKGMNPTAVQLAEQIIAAQEAEIAQMQQFLEVFGAEEMPAPADQQAVWDKNFADMQAATPEEVDVVFLTNMVPHHSAAVPMSQLEITQGSYQPAIDLAEQIKATQREEIATMVMLLRSGLA